MKIKEVIKLVSKTAGSGNGLTAAIEFISTHSNQEPWRAYHGAKDVPEGTLKSILRQAGLE